MPKTHTTHEEVVELVTKLKNEFDKDGGLKHVYLVACGGSHANLEPLNFMLNNEAKTIHSENINAQEFADATPKACGKNSLVIGLSLLGGTRETVAALAKAKECNAKVITIGGVEKCKIAEHSDYHMVSLSKDIALGHVGLLLRIGFEILKQFEGFKGYSEVISKYKTIDELTKKAKAKAKREGKKWGEAHKDKKVVYTMASGILYDFAYMSSICLFMEMEWVNTNSIHSGEYFHGPFEITDQNVPFLIIKALGRTRPLDERAIKFANKFSDDVYVIDAKDYIGNKLGKYEEYLQAIVMSEVNMSFMEEYMAARKHPMFLRKYMMKEDY